MNYAPCENPSCKSFGKSHPNCRCHAQLAEGGEVNHFCSDNRLHGKDCEYAGGEFHLNLFVIRKNEFCNQINLFFIISFIISLTIVQDFILSEIDSSKIKLDKSEIEHHLKLIFAKYLGSIRV